MESRLAEIDGRLKELQKELLKQANAKNDYTEVADEIYALREQRQNALAAEAEQLVRRLVEKVTVYEEELVVEFKSGLEIRVEI